MIVSRSAAWIRAARRAGWALSLALVLLPAQSFIWSDHIPLPLKVGVGAVAALAAFRPAHGLLVVAGLVPVSHVLVTRVWNAYPFALAEALVLAFLVGYLWQQRGQALQVTPPDDVAVSARLLVLVVLASCASQYAVLQVLHDYPFDYAVSFVKFLSTDYLTTNLDPRPWVDGRSFVSTAALLVEGVALLGCTRALCLRQPTLARRLISTVVAAGAGTALLSFYEPVRDAFAGSQPVITMMRSHRWTSPAIPSLNTAGVYFVFVAFLAIGIAAASRAYLLPGLVAGAFSIGAMWLTRTRSAIVAGLTIAVAGFVWWASGRFHRLTPPRAVLVSALGALAVAVSVVVYNPFHILAAGGSRSLHWRALFAETALRMIASEPLVGVGVGQYTLRYSRFASPELLKYYDHSNAHNYFLWVGAELGLIGLGLFVWLVISALARSWSYVRTRQADYAALGTLAALTAFIITWSIGQPLAVPQVAYTFWMVLGMAAAQSPYAARSPADHTRSWVLARVVPVVTILLLAGALPIKTYRAISEIDLGRVAYGFGDWEMRSDGTRFRSTRQRATFFVNASAVTIDVPFATDPLATPHGAQVDIVVDGVAMDPVMLTDGAWRPVRLMAPVGARRFWRVDLRVSPTWIARAAGTDRREAGVAVGETSVVAERPQSN